MKKDKHKEKISEKKDIKELKKEMSNIRKEQRKRSNK